MAAQHDEGFYVVSGTVAFTVGEKTYEAATGTLVMIPPGAPHTFANPGDQPAVLLDTLTPDLYVQYSNTCTMNLDGAGPVDLTVAEYGEGRPFAEIAIPNSPGSAGPSSSTPPAWRSQAIPSPISSR